MSAPSRAWMRTASSGVTRSRVPSYGETNVAALLVDGGHARAG